MERFEKHYKTLGVAGGPRGVQLRLETNMMNRKSSRLTDFDKSRSVVQQEEAYRNNEEMKKWKEEKDRKKKEAASQKKKIFHTVVRQRQLFGQPPPPLRPMASTSGRVTRSPTRQKTEFKGYQSFAPSNAKFKPPKFLKKVPTLAPVTKKQSTIPKITITFAPVLHVKPNDKAKAPLQLSSSSSSNMEQTKTTRKTSPSQPRPPAKYAYQSSSSSDMEEKTFLRSKPSQEHVAISDDSGCCSAHVSMISQGSLDEDNSVIDSVNHLRRQLDSEMARITGLCKTWERVSAETDLPEPLKELGLAAVGHAHLMSNMMSHFSELVEQYARPEAGAATVMLADLQAVWDTTITVQMEDVHIRFKKVEEEALQAKEVVAEPTPGPLCAVEESKSRTSVSGKPEAASSQVKTIEAGSFRFSSPLKLANTPSKYAWEASRPAQMDQEAPIHEESVIAATASAVEGKENENANRLTRQNAVSDDHFSP